MTTKCYVCGGNISADNVKYDENDGYTRYYCGNCGLFKVRTQEAFDKNHVASYLYYKCRIPQKLDIDKRCLYIGYREILEKIWQKDPQTPSATIQEIEDWYPQTFSKKINTIIDTISFEFSELSELNSSSSIEMTYEQCCSAFFVKRYNPDNSETTKKERDEQIEFVKSYLLKNKNNFFKVEISSGKILITILPDDLEIIDKLKEDKLIRSMWSSSTEWRWADK